MHNNFSKLKLSILFSILFLIFSCLVFFFLYKKINENKKITEKIQTEWQTEATKREEIRSLERSIKELEKEKNLLESHFVHGSNIVPLLDAIEQLALRVKAKSEITSVDFSKDNNSLLLGIKASGSFVPIYKFLMLLENFPYELEFSSVDIKKTDTQWEAVFKIKILSFTQ